MLTALAVALPALPASAAPAGDWGIPVLLETDGTGHASAPRVAVDSNGNAIAVWDMSDGQRNNVFASLYTAGTGWGVPALLETENTYSAFGPQVAMDSAGNAIAVWSQYDGLRNNLWSNRYQAGTGWGTPALAEADSYTVDSFALAMDPNGNATIAWSAYDALGYSVYGNRFVAGTGWGTAGTLEADANTAYNVDVAAGGDGSAIVAWQQHDGTRFDVYYNRWVPGTGWAGRALAEADSTFTAAGGSKVAMEANGNAVVVFAAHDGMRYNVYSNRYVVGTGWGTAAAIESFAGSPSDLRVAQDGAGSFFAAWRDYDGSKYNVWGNRYQAGFGWGTAEALETATGNVINFALGGGAGTATVTWAQTDGLRHNLLARNYEPGVGWGATRMVEANNAGPASDSSVGLDGAGNPIVVYRQSDGSIYDVWAVHYGAGLSPLAVAVGSPADGLETNEPTVLVSGTVTPGADIEVNGLVAFVASDGAWSVRVALDEGANAIQAKAWDVAGNQASATVTVTFTDPRVFVEENLTATQAALDAAEASLASTQSQLTTTQGNLAAAQSQLAAANADITALETDLAATKSAQAASDASQTASINAAASSAGTASMLGILGIVIGLAGIGMGFMMSRRGGGAKPAETKPAPEPPKAL